MNIPIKYLPKRLTLKDRKQQLKQLKRSRNAYKKHIYITRKKVKSYKSKKSQHLLQAQKIYKLTTIAVNANLSKKTGCSIKSLRKIVNKGRGAYYSSGSRPNQTAESWGLARLASSITGGKAAAVDYNILEQGCSKNSKALKLARQAKKKHGHGTRRVAKIKL
jgi:nitrate reductase beta subunit